MERIQNNMLIAVPAASDEARRDIFMKINNATKKENASQEALLKLFRMPDADNCPQ